MIVMEKIYQGETLNLVFRCFNKDGSAAFLEGADVSVMLTDGFGDVAYRFSTLDLEGVKPVTVDGHFVICRLSEEDMSRLSGVYTIEVKVTKGGVVMIEKVKGVKIYGSVIGGEVEL